MVKHLTKAEFKAKVFDFEKNKEWRFAGERPCIVDFYADWCQPCKMLSPVLDELAVEYAGGLDIYKINTEKEPELAAAFGIRSIPTMLFIPQEGQPQMSTGVLPKGAIKKTIEDYLGVEEPAAAGD